jgi:hypothetical protein
MWYYQGRAIIMVAIAKFRKGESGITIASQLNEANIIIITGYLILALSMFVGSWVGEVLSRG